jgi:hypothetical protein
MTGHEAADEKITYRMILTGSVSVDDLATVLKRFRAHYHQERIVLTASLSPTELLDVIARLYALGCELMQINRVQ